MDNSTRREYLRRIHKTISVEDVIHETEAGRKARAYERALRTLGNMYDYAIEDISAPVVSQFNDELTLEKAVSEYEYQCRRALDKALHVLKDKDKALLEEFTDLSES